MQVSPTMTDATVQGPEAFELLRRLELLRSLDDSTLKALIEGVEPVELQEGQVLVRQGELDDALYAVASGTLRAVTVPSGGEEKVFERYGPGGVLGSSWCSAGRGRRLLRQSPRVCYPDEACRARRALGPSRQPA
jgi:Cyclic nucleotide-binding domain